MSGGVLKRYWRLSDPSETELDLETEIVSSSKIRLSRSILTQQEAQDAESMLLFFSFAIISAHPILGMIDL